MSSDYVSPKLKAAEYAVRGVIAARSDQIKKDLANGKKFPFENILPCHMGNPQMVGQKPLTYNRQVMALFDAPFLLHNKKVTAQFPPDVVARVRSIMAEIGDTTGAYTNSKGHAFVRRDVAGYITDRDRRNSGKMSLPASDPENVVITDGSSPGVRMILQLALDGPQDAAMIPIPQYPLYTALLTLMGATAAPYFLNEDKGWDLAMSDLEVSHAAAVAKGSTPRVIVVINPGNPTGQVLSRAAVADVVRFAHSKKMIIVADEVYQENTYIGAKPFHSFREVILTMPETDVRTETMLVSLHTTSKGIIGECGRRGGFFEHLNFPPALVDQVIKMISINLCSNVNGQLMVSLLCRPPRKGEYSYDSYTSEYNAIYNEMRRKASHLAKELNTIPGFTCNPIEGAMYAFPRITLPKGYIAYCNMLNKKEGRAKPLSPDTRWCLELLEQTGIVLVAGSGFGQAAGTFHFRTTILPPEQQMKRFTAAVRDYQARIESTYGTSSPTLSRL